MQATACGEKSARMVDIAGSTTKRNQEQEGEDREDRCGAQADGGVELGLSIMAPILDSSTWTPIITVDSSESIAAAFCGPRAGPTCNT